MLVDTETLPLRLCVGLFDEDDNDDSDNVNVEVVHADVDADGVIGTLIVTIPEAEVLADADNREDTEADDESNGLLDGDVDCEDDINVDIVIIDDGDKIFDIEFIVD